MTAEPKRGPTLEPASAWHGPRGEWLVAIQFLLFFAFVLAPRWNPWLARDLWEWSQPVRLTLLVSL